MTALMWASKMGYIENIKTLVKYGAKMDLVDMVRLRTFNCFHSLKCL